MKKNLKFKIIITILIILILSFAFRIYSSKVLRSNVELFMADIKEDYKFVGVTDDKFYYLEDTILKGFSKDEQIFHRPVGLGISDIIYGRYIYVFEKNGEISVLNRNTGNELKRVNLEKDIEKARMNRDGTFDIYSKHSITRLDKKLKKRFSLDNLDKPIKFSLKSDVASVIEMTFDSGLVYSKFSVFKNGEKTYSISTSNELFLYTSILKSQRQLLISNRYIYIIDQGQIVEKRPIEKLKDIDYFNKNYVMVDGKNIIRLDDDFNEISRDKIDMDIRKISIRKNSIALIAEKEIGLLENSTIIKSPIDRLLSYYISNQGVYLIFDKSIEKVKAY